MSQLTAQDTAELLDLLSDLEIELAVRGETHRRGVVRGLLRKLSPPVPLARVREIADGTARRAAVAKWPASDARTASAATMAPVHEIFEGILKTMSGEAK